MKATQSLADAARNLLANVNTDNDNNGTYAALQAALDAHDFDAAVIAYFANRAK